MKRLLLVLGALALQPTASVPAMAANLKSEFTSAWSGRQSQYEAEARSALDRQRTAITAYAATKSPATDPTATAKANDVLDATSEYGIVQGRLAQIVGLQSFFATNPSKTATEIWLQARVSEIQTLSRKAEAEWRQARMAAAPQAAADEKTYISKALQAIAFLGIVRGLNEEARLIDENLGSYFRAKGENDDARRRARAAIFGALAGALQQSAQQPLIRPPTTVRCDTYGASTTCRGQ